ncbi:MAG TPA: hypothetical protein QF753_13100 [Victivallales bacterium]|nr:hypothetical protein [Victivallales bacterium]
MKKRIFWMIAFLGIIFTGYSSYAFSTNDGKIIICPEGEYWYAYINFYNGTESPIKLKENSEWNVRHVWHSKDKGTLWIQPGEYKRLTIEGQNQKVDNSYYEASGAWIQWDVYNNYENYNGTLHYNFTPIKSTEFRNYTITGLFQSSVAGWIDKNSCTDSSTYANIDISTTDASSDVYFYEMDNAPSPITVGNYQFLWESRKAISIINEHGKHINSISIPDAYSKEPVFTVVHDKPLTEAYPYVLYYKKEDGRIGQIRFNPDTASIKVQDSTSLQWTSSVKALNKVDMLGNEVPSGSASLFGLMRIPALGNITDAIGHTIKTYQYDTAITIYDNHDYSYSFYNLSDSGVGINSSAKIVLNNTDGANNNNLNSSPSGTPHNFSYIPFIGEGGAYQLAVNLNGELFFVSTKLSPSSCFPGLMVYNPCFIQEVLPQTSFTKCTQKVSGEQKAKTIISLVQHNPYYNKDYKPCFRFYGETYDWSSGEVAPVIPQSKKLSEEGFVTKGLIISLPPDKSYNPDLGADKTKSYVPAWYPSASVTGDATTTLSNSNSNTKSGSTEDGKKTHIEFGVPEVFDLFKFVTETYSSTTSASSQFTNECTFQNKDSERTYQVTEPNGNCWIGFKPKFLNIIGELEGPNGEKLLGNTTSCLFSTAVLDGNPADTEFCAQHGDTRDPDSHSITKGMEPYFPGPVSTKSIKGGNKGVEDFLRKMDDLKNLSEKNVGIAKMDFSYAALQGDTADAVSLHCENGKSKKTESESSVGIVEKNDSFVSFVPTPTSDDTTSISWSTSSTNEVTEGEKWGVKMSTEGYTGNHPEDGNALTCTPVVYMVSVQKLKANNIDRHDPGLWFMSDYVWDNNQSFWVLAYQNVGLPPGFSS